VRFGKTQGLRSLPVGVAELSELLRAKAFPAPVVQEGAAMEREIRVRAARA
jgi:hypothetical protein